MDKKLILSAIVLAMTTGASAQQNAQSKPAAQKNAPEQVDTLPDAPKPGTCYAQLAIPAKYEIEKEKVMVSPESFTIEVVPAKYETVEEKVLVKPAYEEIAVVPAKFEPTETVVTVREEERVMKATEPVFKTETEAIQVGSGIPRWVKGENPYEKVDNFTGQILCYKDAEAKAQLVEKQVLVSEASVVEEVIPAKTTAVKAVEMVEPAQVVKKEVPAEYKTVEVRKIVEPAKQVKKTIPAKYETIEKRVEVSPSKISWEPVVCETNLTNEVVTNIQKALKEAGTYNGAIDGVIGQGTVGAIDRYQKEQDLVRGGITMEMIAALNISL